MRTAGDGASVDDHMAIVKKRRGDQADADAPKCPPELAYLFKFWMELHSARGCGMGVNPISWSDMLAFSALYDEPLAPWEAKALRKLENEFITTVGDDGSGGT